jgi:hypothetical protein
MDEQGGGVRGVEAKEGCLRKEVDTYTYEYVYDIYCSALEVKGGGEGRTY